jgi:monothiol glutaredoxin
MTDPKSIEISAKETFELWKKGAVKLLDVRGEDERGLAKIEGVPMMDRKLAQEITSEWKKETPIVFHCHHGIRSLEAVWYLNNQGFTDVKSMTGGIDAWSCDVDPSVPRY